MKRLFLLSILLVFSCETNQGEISDLKDTVEDLNKQISELQSSQVTSENNSTAMQNQVNELVQKIDSLEKNTDTVEGLKGQILELQNVQLSTVNNTLLLQNQVNELVQKIDSLDINTDVDLKQQILELQSSQVASENNSTALQNQVNGLVQKIAALEINSEKYNSEVVGCYRWGEYNFDVLKNGIGVYETSLNIPSTTVNVIFVWEKMDNVIKFTFPDLFLTYFSLSFSNGLGHIKPGNYIVPLNNLNTLSFPASANNCAAPCNRSFVKNNCPN